MTDSTLTVTIGMVFNKLLAYILNAVSDIGYAANYTSSIITLFCCQTLKIPKSVGCIGCWYENYRMRSVWLFVNVCVALFMGAYGYALLISL